MNHGSEHQITWQRQHILLSYFKTLSVGPVWGSNPRPPAQQTGALPTELTSQYEVFCSRVIVENLQYLVTLNPIIKLSFV